MTTEFHHCFANQDQADSYAKTRPTYPPSLFEKLASLTLQHERAWDVGTGNGQAAVAVAQHYKSVVATDVSEAQLSHAIQHPNVTYAKMSATPSAEELERVVGPEGSVDLVTVATALHWFNLDTFYPIVKHVLRKPGGVFAAWVYGGKAADIYPEFNEEYDRFVEKAKVYRTNRSEYTIGEYKNLPFPFEPVPGVEAGVGVEGHPETLMMEKVLTFDDLIGFLRSGPPIQVALDQGVDLLNEDQINVLAKAWGPEKEHSFFFPLFLLLGTVSPTS